MHLLADLGISFLCWFLLLLHYVRISNQCGSTSHLDNKTCLKKEGWGELLKILQFHFNK